MDLVQIKTIAERVGRPGLMSPVGVRRERRCASDLKRYFDAVAHAIEGAHLERLVMAQDSKERVLARVAQRVEFALIRYRPLLLQALAVNMHEAYLEADRLQVLREADEDPRLEKLLRQASRLANERISHRVAGSVRASVIDMLGPTGREAAEWAARQAAALVSGVDKTTRERIRRIIEQGIEEQLGVVKTARLLRAELESMGKYRSLMIAQTEMNNAMSESTLRKIRREGFEWKQLIPSPDACEVCLAIEAAGPVKTSDPFEDEDGEKYMRTPIHPGCRCAISAAMPPKGED